MKKIIFMLFATMVLLCYNPIVHAAEADEHGMTAFYDEEELGRSIITDVKEVKIEQVGEAYIPNNPFSGNLVNNAEVIYRLKYKVTAKKKDGSKVTNMPVVAYYSAAVTGVKITGINSSGEGFIEIDVRGPKSYTLYSMVDGVRSNQISATQRVAAYYQNSFHCTAYIVALESDYSASKVAVSGITDAKFKSDFLADVKMNGTGKADSGKYIHWNGSGYSYIDKLTTATGTEATAGRTIAVKSDYIPMAKVGGRWKRATVNISGIGNRVAEDGGKDIEGYDIDVFMGTGKNTIKTWGDMNRTVRLISVN